MLWFVAGGWLFGSILLACPKVCSDSLAFTLEGLDVGECVQWAHGLLALCTYLDPPSTLYYPPSTQYEDP